MAILVLLCVYCCKHKVHNFVEVLDELYVRYFVSDADTRRQRSIFLCRFFFVSIFSEKPCTPVQISLHLLKLPVSPTQSPRFPGSFSQLSRHSLLKGLAPCEVSVFSGPAVPFFLLLLKGHGSLCAERFVAFLFFRKILLI